MCERWSDILPHKHTHKYIRPPTWLNGCCSRCGTCSSSSSSITATGTGTGAGGATAGEGAGDFLGLLRRLPKMLRRPLLLLPALPGVEAGEAAWICGSLMEG